MSCAELRLTYVHVADANSVGTAAKGQTCMAGYSCRGIRGIVFKSDFKDPVLLFNQGVLLLHRSSESCIYWGSGERLPYRTVSAKRLDDIQLTGWC